MYDSLLKLKASRFSVIVGYRGYSKEVLGLGGFTSWKVYLVICNFYTRSPSESTCIMGT